ncbi:MAG: ABC transporter permease [Bacteroidia bacterium]|nr:ABC transporter permease [Bacteroidia bacterium]
MNTEFYIARRIITGKGGGNRISRPIVTIAVAGIALGLAVMIISVAVVAGFKSEIRNKVFGFGSHIQIINYDSNYSYETTPIRKDQSFLPELKKLKGVTHIQYYATKPGIIKTTDNIQGVILKGVSSDFDWNFFDEHMVNGRHLVLPDTVKSNEVVISKKLSQLLNLNVGNNLSMYFIQDPPRMRKFKIVGIYQTYMEEFDKMFVIADLRHIQKLNDWGEDSISGFEISINDFDNINEIAANVFDIAGTKIQPDGSKLRVQTIIEKYPYIFDWIGLFNTNLWVILVLMVLVAGFNMISGLLIMILERTNMIGILKAMGSKDASIRKIFLYNGAFLITKGLFWGNLLGIGLCLIQYYFRVFTLDQASYYIEYVPVYLNITQILLLNIGALVVTFLMLIIPSFVISRITPVRAIKFN